MSVKGYLVFVPFENVASYEYGNNGAPDKATVATTPGKLAGPFEVRQVVNDEFSALASLIAREDTGLPPAEIDSPADLRPARLSADLTMSDGRLVHVPVVPTPKEPASAGKIRVDIPYPANAMPGLVISAAVINEDLGVVFRSGFPYTHAQAGDTLTVEFGEESIDAEALAKIFGERP